MGQNVASQLPLLSTQLSGRAHHAKIHTGDAGQFYISAGVSSSEFGAVCGNWCALLGYNIPFFPTFPSTHHTNSCSKGTIRTRKNQAIQRYAQVGKWWGGCKVMP